MQKRRGFTIIGLVAILLAGTIILVGSVAANDAPLLNIFPLKAFQQTGPLNLIMSVTPQAVQVGDKVNLEIMVTSGRSETAVPEIQIVIPENLSFNSAELPSGTSFNIQTNTINWQPILESGGSRRILVPLTVNVTYPSRPELPINAVLVDGQNRQEYSTSLWAGMPPQVAVVFDPPQVAVGQPVQIKANLIGGAGPVTQRWSLGDGRVLDVHDPVVVFPAAGTFQVSVEVANPVGTTTASSLINVVPVPAASFSIDDSTPSVNQSITFINESGGEGTIIYRWNFGDGTISTEKNPTHAYVGPGTFLVTLQVQNEFGQTETRQQITVGQQPIADIVLPNSAIAGSLVPFQAFTDDSVTNVTWDMGDGRTYEGRSINHVYWQAGEFNITMTASNNYSTFQVSKVILIEPGALAFYLPIIRKGGQSEAYPGVLETVTLDPSRPESATEEVFEYQPLIAYEFPPNLNQEEQLLAYINQARELNGLAPVTYNAQVSLAAQAHTFDMASNGFGGVPGNEEFTPHTGTDGSTPALRLQRTGYPGGYGAEATAWGFQTALGPAEFWLNNPPHRRIILNPYVDEVGLSYARNLDAPNIWYWTAVFASMSIPKVEVPEVVATPAPNPTPTPVLQLLGPPQNSEFVLAPGNNLIFTWTWDAPLEEGQRFVVYLNSAGRTFQIGSVQQSIGNNQYQFKTAVTNVPVSSGQFEWQVRLENVRDGIVLESSPFWPVQFVDSAGPTPLPIATPEPTATATP